MIPLFPVFLAFLLVIWVLCIAVATIIGFFCGPMMMAVNYVNCGGLAIAILCPILMVVGALTGFFSAFCLGTVVICSKCAEYWRLVGRIFCNPGSAASDQPEELFDVEGK